MRRSSLVCLLALAALLLSSGPASAHTELESSVPSGGETVDSPVDEIVLVFSGPVQPVGSGFVVRDPEGNTRVPDQVMSADDEVWRLTFDPAIGAGVVAVKWDVQTPDAHPIGGRFVFTVEVASTQVAPMAPSMTTTTTTSVGAGDVTVVELSEFLATDEGSSLSGSVAGLVGRLFGLGGGVLAIGGVVFVLAVLSPLDEERRLVLGWVVVAGLLAATGGVLESVARDASTTGQWSITNLRTLTGDPAAAIRAGSGLVLALSAALGMGRLRVREPVAALPGVLVGSGPGVVPSAGENPQPEWSPVEPLEGRLAAGAGAGVAGIAGSYSFDGHTVTAGHRLVTSAVDLAHVLASSVWAGGVVALALVVWVRHRRGQAIGGLGLVVRFSVIAAVAVALAGGAGLVLAATILDSVDALWSTSWGRILVAKTSMVFAAAGVGAYNHYIVMPWMAVDPFDDERSQRLRKTVTVETALMVGVVVLTGALVVASPN